MSPPPDLSSASDQDLVAWALQRREEGYRGLLHRYAPSVFHRIYEIVRDYDLAEDLVQDTFVKAFNALDTHDLERNFSGWIDRIAYNTAIDHVRRKSLQTLPLFNTAETSPPPGTFNLPAAPVAGRTASREARKNAASRALEQAMRQLPRDQRRCIKLRFFEKRTNNEVAQILGLPPGTVKTHVHRGLNRLQEMLDPLFPSWRSDSMPTDPFYSPL